MDPNKISNSKNNQLDRLSSFLRNCSKALQETKDIIIATDDNIDTNTENDSHLNQTLLTCINDFLTDNNMTRINNDNTRFTPNTRPSAIDHIYTNVPHKFNNMTTHDRLITDHKILSVKYCANAKISIPKFIKKPDHITN